MSPLLFAKLHLALLAARTRQRLIGPKATHILCESSNGKLLVPCSDFYIGRELAYRGEYDRKHVDKLLTLVGPDSSVLFVGAHIGALVIPVARKVREVTAIEANPFIFDTLLMNLSLNGCGNVRALNVAASDEPGEIELLVSTNNTGGSKIAPKNPRREFTYDHPKTVKVGAARLDDVLEDLTPSLIVMDIEGAEVRALKGMPRLLQSCKTLLVEFLPNHIENIAGISCDTFVKLLPFEKICLMDDPAEKDIVNHTREHCYYGGADLLCTR